MYQLNSPRVVHETLDGETIIIDTLSGLYYTVSGQASVVWSALAGGCTPSGIAAAYAAAGRPPPAIDAFLEQLLAAELLLAGEASAEPPVFVLPELAAEADDGLRLQSHADLQELIELDPIHEVDIAQGWPIQPPEQG